MLRQTGSRFYKMTKSGNELLDVHFREVGEYSLPSSAEELSMFTAYRAARTRSELSTNVMAREAAKEEYKVLAQRIACGYLRFVIRQARRKSHGDWLFSDLISAGYEGLMHAITLFEPERGNRFLTYASNWINVRMQECLYKVRVVHVPSHTRKEMRKTRVENEKRQAAGEASQGFEEPVISSIEGIVIQDETVDIERETITKAIDGLSLLAQANLSRVERLVLIYLFGLRGGEPKSVEEVGQLLYEIDGSQMTPARVGDVRDRGLKRLRDHLSQEEIDGLADIFS